MFKILILSSALILSSVANAALQVVDWKSSGDGLSTLDTQTGIEWIDIAQTRNYSIASILPELNSGGRFYGWRLPTQSEVETLFTNHFGAGVLNVASSTSNSSLVAKGFSIASALDFSQKIGGGFYGSTGYLYSGGKFKRDDGKQGLSGFIVSVNGSVNGWYFNPNTTHLASPSSMNSWDAVYLVSDGGLTLSSKNDPTLNIQNPNAPINTQSQTPSVVNSPALLGMIAMLSLFSRRKMKLKR